MNKEEETIIIVCECHSVEHQLVITEFNDEEDNNFNAYVSIHLTKKSFFERLKHGLKYIFGYQCKYGAFDEVLLSNNNTKQLKKMLDKWHND